MKSRVNRPESSSLTLACCWHRHVIAFARVQTPADALTSLSQFLDKDMPVRIVLEPRSYPWLLKEFVRDCELNCSSPQKSLLFCAMQPAEKLSYDITEESVGCPLSIIRFFTYLLPFLFFTFSQKLHNLNYWSFLESFDTFLSDESGLCITFTADWHWGILCLTNNPTQFSARPHKGKAHYVCIKHSSSQALPTFPPFPSQQIHLASSP